MRIPLDYYRILSVPVKATIEQLNQAYSDRLLQQPRREYSETAIEARQELIKYSYQVLSDSAQRAIYDAQFLLNMQPSEAPKILESVDIESLDSSEDLAEIVELEEGSQLAAISLANPTIEISSTQLVGALLILHELGEYETVLSLGIDFFNNRELDPEATEDEVTLDTTQEDLLLSLALAYLELGREQWHRQEYENAAISGRMGIELLQQKSLFPHIQEELERDLSKLRPYRVLELVSQNPVQSEARTQGFQLLQSMMLQRQGIEGKGEDRSGLNFDQFLCFIQQLRTYLTSAEQQQLFDNERNSNSAIANYLAVYALLGRGFCLKQPELVLRAQRKLDSLSEKQDVSWEQGISALLLGHTEKAIYKLRHASDTSRLEAVQQHSYNSSDLLPGLCFYGEQWLQQDVIAQFRDLSTTKLTLKEYFADQQVQAYLEELAPPTVTATAASGAIAKSTQYSQPEPVGVGIMSLWRSIFSTEKSEPVKASSSVRVASSSRELVGAGRFRGSSSTSTATIERHQSTATIGNSKSNYSGVTTNNHHRNSRSKSPTLPMQPRTKTRAVPSSVVQKAQGKAHRKKAAPKKKLSAATLWKGRLFILGLIFGAGTIGYLGIKLFLTPKVKTVSKAPLAIALSQPTVTIPPKKIEPKPAPPKLTFLEQSQQVVQTWLDVKSAVFGQKHQVEQLNQILAEPLLTTWRGRATVYRADNLHREYQHQITMRSAKIDPNDQNKATVEAEVKEVAKHYQSGEFDNAQSYDDNLLVRYQLIRKQDKWLIHQTEVLKTL